MCVEQKIEQLSEVVSDMTSVEEVKAVLLSILSVMTDDPDKGLCSEAVSQILEAARDNVPVAVGKTFSSRRFQNR